VATIGLIVNPAAGRDIRRLTGGASVVDNYAKRRVAECVCDGLTVAGEPVEVLVMPDRTGIADHAVAKAPEDEGIDATTLEMPIEESSADTRRAAARFRDEADAAVVLGGDGTTRDAALELGDVPAADFGGGGLVVNPDLVEPRSVDDQRAIDVEVREGVRERRRAERAPADPDRQDGRRLVEAVGRRADRLRVGRLGEGQGGVAELVVGHARGDPVVCGRDPVVETLQRLSQLATDFPAILELDVNPLVAGPDGVQAIDLRLTVDKDEL